MHQKLILGTVQLGLSYGINNTTGKPSQAQAFDILDTAFANGITVLDSAEAYGDSLEVIGAYAKHSGKTFDIISKFKYQPDIAKGRTLRDNVRRSLDLLHIAQLEGYLLHSFSESDEHLNERLQELKAEKLIKYAGTSVYDNAQLEAALATEAYDIIQLPFNVLDNWQLRGDLLATARARNKQIHIRSVFLQGVFFMDTTALPIYLQPLAPHLRYLQALATDYQLAATNYCVELCPANVGDRWCTHWRGKCCTIDQ